MITSTKTYRSLLLHGFFLLHRFLCDIVSSTNSAVALLDGGACPKFLMRVLLDRGVCARYASFENLWVRVKQ